MPFEGFELPSMRKLGYTDAMLHRAVLETKASNSKVSGVDSDQGAKIPVTPHIAELPARDKPMPYKPTRHL